MKPSCFSPMIIHSFTIFLFPHIQHVPKKELFYKIRGFKKLNKGACASCNRTCWVTRVWSERPASSDDEHHDRPSHEGVSPRHPQRVHGWHKNLTIGHQTSESDNRQQQLLQETAPCSDSRTEQVLSFHCMAMVEVFLPIKEDPTDTQPSCPGLNVASPHWRRTSKTANDAVQDVAAARERQPYVGTCPNTPTC